MDERDSLRLAQVVRAACASAAIEAHEDAGVQGLCAEGRFEAAIAAIERMDLAGLLRRTGGDGAPGGKQD